MLVVSLTTNITIDATRIVSIALSFSSFSFSGSAAVVAAAAAAKCPSFNRLFTSFS